MRTPLLLIALGMTSCGREDASRFTLQYEKVERINGCHLILDGAPGRGEVPLAAMRYVCGVSESALKEEQWWGDQRRPLMFTVSVGDCLPLDDTFYCVEEIKLGEAAFKATYKWSDRHHTSLELIR
jgi:hypothetical protein